MKSHLNTRFQSKPANKCEQTILNKILIPLHPDTSTTRATGNTSRATGRQTILQNQDVQVKAPLSLRLLLLHTQSNTKRKERKSQSEPYLYGGGSCPLCMVFINEVKQFFQ